MNIRNKTYIKRWWLVYAAWRLVLRACFIC